MDAVKAEDAAGEENATEEDTNGQKEDADKEAYQKMLAELEKRELEDVKEEAEEDEYTVRWKKAREVAKEAWVRLGEDFEKQARLKDKKEMVMEHLALKV